MSKKDTSLVFSDMGDFHFGVWLFGVLIFVLSLVVHLPFIASNEGMTSLNIFTFITFYSVCTTFTIVLLIKYYYELFLINPRNKNLFKKQKYAKWFLIPYINIILIFGLSIVHILYVLFYSFWESIGIIKILSEQEVEESIDKFIESQKKTNETLERLKQDKDFNSKSMNELISVQEKTLKLLKEI